MSYNDKVKLQSLKIIIYMNYTFKCKIFIKKKNKSNLMNVTIF